MATLLHIAMGVKRRVDRQEVKRELADARQERQEAAEERRIMQEQLRAMQGNHSGDIYRVFYNNGYVDTPANAMYPEAEILPMDTASPYAGAQPMGATIQGVPVQMSAPSYPFQVNEPGMTAAGPLVYCQECEGHHAAPVCHPMSRRERRAERREERHERRQERRDERRARRSRS